MTTALFVLLCCFATTPVIQGYKIHPTYYVDDANVATLHYDQESGQNTKANGILDWSMEVPFWPMYPTRTVQVLDGNWNFGYQGSNWNVSHVIDPKAFAGLTPNITSVPSAFDVKPPGILGPRGTAFYRTYVETAKGNDIQVYFAACAFYCQLYVDGAYVGDHRAGGYQPFWFYLPNNKLNQQNTTHELFVLVDNRWNAQTAPTYTNGDFYSYGGITRNVMVHTMPIPNSANNALIRVETFPNDIKAGTIDVNITFTNAFNKDETKDFIFCFDDKTNVSMANVNVNAGAQYVRINGVAVPNPSLWSLKNPNLHTLQVYYVDSSQHVLDSIQVRFGLRQIGIDASTKRITLNGDIVKLHGYNRHTMWPDTGNALTYSQVEQDVRIILEQNVNYIRGAHYPQDQRFLDLCDENGIAVWSETLGPGTKTADFLNPYWMQHQIQAVNEMVDASVNNPSVFWWAFYNEGPSNDVNACPGYNASASALRARDPSRMITWANNHEMSDVCTVPIADIASFNNYPAWYADEGDVADCYKHWNEMAADVQQKWPTKAFLISETGAGGVYEYNNVTNIKWSQLFESQVVYADAFTALNNSFISGISLWQFNDIKANDGATASCGQCDYYPEETLCAYIDVSCSRPGGENHKGSVDFWRRYKQSFATVQLLYYNFTEPSIHSIATTA